jgi:hypothetical protein
MSRYEPKEVKPLSLEAERELKAIRAMPYGLKGFRRFAKILVLEDGSRFRILMFQAFLLAFYFAGVIELVILLPKKNGKTTLLAALALYHLLMVASAECVIGASSRDQATILFNQGDGLVTRSGLEAVFDVKGGYRIIRLRGEPGRIRVLAADADTADGVIPTLALVDELHRHRDGGLYGIFRDGIDARNGQMITISTAGASLDSPLGRLLERARLLALTQVKRRRTYEAPDGAFVLVEYALETEDDRNDIKLVKEVNPAPWQTKAKLQRRHDSPSMSTGQWLRFACGIWTAGEEPEIMAAEWDKLRVDIGQIEPGERVVLVPSVGHNAAIALVAPRPEGRVACKVEVIEAAEGTSILARTEDRILELCRDYDAEIHAPGVGFIRSRELLADKRLSVVEAPQSVAALSAATGTFNRVLRAGLLMHDGDPILRSHALSATMKTNEAGERYEVTDRARGLIALVMAVHGVTEMGEPTPKIHIFKGA